MDDTVCRFTFRSSLFDSSSGARKPFSHVSFSVRAQTDTEWPVQFSWCVMTQWLHSSVAVLLVGDKSAHNISSSTSCWKIYCTEAGTVALLVTLVDLSTWIVYHGDSSVLSNICVSTSCAISSIHLVMVPTERGICVTVWTAASPKRSWQMSLAAGRISSSPRVKGFLVLVMWLATKNDALSANTFDEVVAFTKCFCSLCSHFFYFEKLQRLVFPPPHLFLFVGG